MYKQKIKRSLSLCMMGVMLTMSFPFNVFAEDGITDYGTAADFIESGSAVSVISENIDAEFNVTGQWDGGFNAEVTLTNITDEKIEDWQIEMEFPHEITNIWNAAIEKHAGKVYNLKGTNGSGSGVHIAPHDTVSFGFTAEYSDKITAPSTVKLIQNKAFAPEEAYSVGYSVNDWGSGFVSTVTITNNMDKPLEAWHLQFDFSGTIENIWNANIEKTENGRYFVSNAGYNADIPANGSVTFGFDGTYISLLSIPKNYTLSYLGSSESITNNTGGQDESPELNDEEAEKLKELDDDGDGVSNYDEMLFGTDPNNEDTDGDQLTDFDELYFTSTSAVEPDTDGNGVSDADEDQDSDGLTNKQETEIGTLPYTDDSDYDGLTDNDELYKYNTSPLSYDTDEDELEDGDEIALGFDPNIPDTDSNGITDANEMFLQSHTSNIDCPQAPQITQVKVETVTSGLLKKNLTVFPTYNKDMYSTNFVGLVGSPFDISLTTPFEKAKVTFIYDPELVEDAETLGVMWYDKESGFYEDMGAVVDTQAHTVTFETTHFSTYLVCNMTKYHDNINRYWDGYEKAIGFDEFENNNEWQGQIVTTEKIPGFPHDYIADVANGHDLYVLQATAVYNLTDGRQLTQRVTYMSNDKPLGKPVLKEAYDGMCALIHLENETFMTYSTPKCKNGSYQCPQLSNGKTALAPAYDDVSQPDFGGLTEITKFFVPAGNGVDRITNSDDDDLKDYEEKYGMLCSNGTAVCTDPHKTDTDDDGISDSDEMGKFDEKRKCYPRHSDPLSKNNDDNDCIHIKDTDLNKEFWFKQNEKMLPNKTTMLTSEFQELCVDIKNMTGYMPYVKYTIIKNEKCLQTGSANLYSIPYSNIFDDNIYVYADIMGLKNSNGDIISSQTAFNVEKFPLSVKLFYLILEADTVVEVKSNIENIIKEDGDMSYIEILYSSKDSPKTFLQTGTYSENNGQLLPLGTPYIINEEERFVLLAHEFIHAYHDCIGKNADSKDKNTKEWPEHPFYTSVKNNFDKFEDFASAEEVLTIGTKQQTDEDIDMQILTENNIRLEHGLKKRLTHHFNGILRISDAKKYSECIL